MHNKNIPSHAELPSMGRLVKSTILAICAAAIILVTVVLPAEYGLDPTGVGAIVGLVKMGEIKVSLASEAAAEKVTKEVPVATSETVPSESTESEAEIPSDEMTITLKPDEGKEIKLAMTEGARVEYVWWTDSGRANFDAHADSKALDIKYHNYSKGSEERNEGVLQAAFDGNHGWFWRNRTSETMTVTLKVTGEYTDIIRY